MAAAIIHAYNNGSKSAKTLAEVLGLKLMNKTRKSAFKGKLIINWGSSDTTLTERYPEATIFNNPREVKRMANKAEFFKWATEAAICIPGNTTDRAVAREWFTKKGAVVVCRTVLNGHSGEGIVLANNEEELIEAPLYTLYSPKTFEFRIQQKRRKLDVGNDDVNWQIRNHQNGFIYSNQDIDKVIKEAMNLGLRRDIEAIEQQLTFGAVDVVVKKDGTYSILEVNTACGMEGETVEFYKNSLGQLLAFYGEGAPQMARIRGANIYVDDPFPIPADFQEDFAELEEDDDE